MTGLGDLALFLGGSEDSFTGNLLRLIVKAQSTPENLAALRRAFPDVVRAWEVWNRTSPAPTADELRAALDRSDAYARVSLDLLPAAFRAAFPGLNSLALGADWETPRKIPVRAGLFTEQSVPNDWGELESPYRAVVSRVTAAFQAELASTGELRRQAGLCPAVVDLGRLKLVQYELPNSRGDYSVRGRIEVAWCAGLAGHAGEVHAATVEGERVEWTEAM
jgi:hypothetical protein